MSWAKVDDGLHDHPKVDAMLEADELHGAAALGLWVAALSYSADQLTDGEITCRALRRLFPEHGLQLAAALVKHNLWDVNDSGWTIRGYLDCNPPREEVLERRRADAERKAAARAQRASERTSGRTPERTSEGNPRGRPDTPTRPDPTRPDPKSSSPAVDGRAPATTAAQAVANGRTTSSSTIDTNDLAEHVRGILQNGNDGLTGDEPCKPPTVAAILAALEKHSPTNDIAITVATEVRSIAQAQNRAPNIAGLYAAKLGERVNGHEATR